MSYFPTVSGALTKLDNSYIVEKKHRINVKSQYKQQENMGDAIRFFYETLAISPKKCNFANKKPLTSHNYG